MATLALPTATLFDAVDSAEGSLDPLGTYLLSEGLASRIGSSGVRERQRNLRFLTLCCIGWEAMASLEPDLKPGDPSATLEQAFEWLTVEALVAGEGEGGPGLSSLPGVNKARASRAQGLHLNADRYLSMPSVFGYFGVYRTLATYIKLVVPRSEDAPLLGPEGARLLAVWRQEQKLESFGRGLRGPGQREFLALSSALKASWLEGQVVPEKQVFAFIQNLLHPLRPGGPREEGELLRLIKEPGQREEDNHRRQILQALEGKDARVIMLAGEPDAEKRFHELIRPSASQSLAVLLDAVKAYEAFVRSLQDLFDDLLFVLSAQSRLFPLKEIAGSLPKLDARVKAMPSLFRAASGALNKVGTLGARFDADFAVLGQAATGEAYLGALLNHHEKVQKQKPPAGKAPWIDHPDERVAVRPLYRRDKGSREDGAYVYFYRTRPLFDLVRGAKGEYGQA